MGMAPYMYIYKYIFILILALHRTLIHIFQGTSVKTQSLNFLCKYTSLPIAAPADLNNTSK